MQPPEHLSQPAPEETPSQPIDPPEEPSEPRAAQEPPSQPLRPPQPYPTRPRPSLPLAPRAQWDSPTRPLRLPRLTPKKRSQLLWVLGGIVALVLIFCIAGLVVVAASSKNASSSAASNPTAGAATAPTSAPTQQGAEHHQVGDTIITARWQVTINSASIYAGNPNQFEVPTAGDTFLVLRGTFKNLTDTVQPLSTLQFFALEDAQGNTYTQAFFNSLTPPDGVILANDTARGEWGYDVPTSLHAFVLVFSDDAGQTTSLWDVSV